MRRSISIAWIACLGLLPCDPTSPTAFAQGNADQSAAELPDPYPGPADPINVTATGDFARRVRGQIGPSGGTLQTVGADGTSYDLIVPQGALRDVVDISMEPILEVKGPLLGNRKGMGVILGPDGLLLAKVAKLQISNSGLHQKPDLFAVAGYGHGFDSRLTMFRKDGDVVTIPLWHFTIFRIDVDDLVLSGGTYTRWKPRRREDRLLHWIAQNGLKDGGVFSSALNNYRDWMTKAARGLVGDSLKRNQVCPALRSGIVAYKRARDAARMLSIPLEAFPNEADLGNLSSVLSTECRKQAEEDCSENGDQQILWDQIYAEADAAGDPDSRAYGEAYWSGLLWVRRPTQQKCPLPPVYRGTVTVTAAFDVGNTVSKDLSYRKVDGTLVPGSDKGSWNAKGRATWTFVVTEASGRGGGGGLYSLSGYAKISGNGACSARRTYTVGCNVTESKSDTPLTAVDPFASASDWWKSERLNLRVRTDQQTGRLTYEFNLQPTIVFRGAGRSQRDEKPCPAQKKGDPVITTHIADLAISSDRLGPLIIGPLRPNGSARDRTSFSGKNPFYTSNINSCDVVGLPASTNDVAEVTVDINLPLQDYE